MNFLLLLPLSTGTQQEVALMFSHVTLYQSRYFVECLSILFIYLFVHTIHSGDIHYYSTANDGLYNQDAELSPFWKMKGYE